MTRSSAEKFLNEQIEYCVQKARAAETEEEREHFTDCAHKLYITLASTNGFEPEFDFTESGPVS